MDQDARRALLKKLGIVGVALLMCLLTGVWCHKRMLLVGMTSPKVALPLFAAGAYVLASGLLLVVKDHAEALVQKLLPVSLVVFGMAYGLLLPLGTVPDEYIHLLNSIELSMILEGKSINEIRAADAEASEEVYDAIVTLAKDKDYLSRPLLLPESSEEDAALVKRQAEVRFSLGTHAPQLRLPCALGMLIGRKLGLAPIATFYLSRLFNLLYATLLICAAIRITPVGKNIIVVLAFMPMTMQLIASASYDAGIIGLSFLLTSIIMRIWYGDEPAGVRDIVELLVVVFLLAPCKIVYATISFIPLFIPSERFASKRLEGVAKLGAPLVAIASIGIFKCVDLAFFLDTNGQRQISYREMVGHTRYYTVQDIVQDPTGIALMFPRTIYALGFDWITMFVGRTLAHFQGNLHAPLLFVYLYLALLLYATLATAQDSVVFSRTSRMGMVVLVALTVLATMGGMLLGWTLIESNVIQGVQGRYFIPIAIPLLLAMRSKHISAPSDNFDFVLFCSYTLECCYLMHLYTSVLMS